MLGPREIEGELAELDSNLVVNTATGLAMREIQCGNQVPEQLIQLHPPQISPGIKSAPAFLF